MEAIYNLGVQIVVFLQSLGGWFIGLMRFFSYLGKEEFLLLVAPALFWCVDAGLGLRTGLALMISNGVNASLKLAFHAPRPYWYNPSVQPLAAETSFGMPSNHSQSAVVVWGLIAAWIGKTWSWIVAITLMFMIGLSRIHLGVHFPTDVLVGWVIGAILLWAVLHYEKSIINWFRSFSTKNQVLIVLGVSLVIILIGIIIRLTLGNWTVPESWASLASRIPNSEPIDPLALSGLVSAAGVFFGLALGGIILYQRGWFNARGPAWQLIVRYIIGLVGVIAIWDGLGGIFPRGESILPFILRYIRYALVGLWITGLAPLWFIQLKLAKPGQAKLT